MPISMVRCLFSFVHGQIGILTSNEAETKKKNGNFSGLQLLVIKPYSFSFFLKS